MNINENIRNVRNNHKKSRCVHTNYLYITYLLSKTTRISTKLMLRQGTLAHMVTYMVIYANVLLRMCININKTICNEGKMQKNKEGGAGVTTKSIIYLLLNAIEY